jgi:hypothetical protein
MVKVCGFWVLGFDEGMQSLSVYPSTMSILPKVDRSDEKMVDKE